MKNKYNYRKFALVLSGGGGRGAAHLGIIKALFEQGIKPDIYIGSSVGAIIAAMMAVYDDVDLAIDKYLAFARKYGWFNLVDFPIFPQKSIKSMGGLIDGQRLIDVITEEAGLSGEKLSQTKKPLYIVSTDLNSGDEIVFGSPQKLRTPKRDHYQPLFYPKDILISKALRASIGLPVLFKPYPRNIGQRKLALLDGGIRDNCPITLAAYLPDVKYIFASVLSFAGQQNIDYFRKDIASVFFEFLEIATSYSQVGKSCENVLFSTKPAPAVRIVNPGLFSISPLALNKSEIMIASAYRTMRSILDKFDDPRQFWQRWDNKKIAGFHAPRWKAERLGQARADIVGITDQRSPVERDLKKKSLKYRLAKLFK
ncbi:MAG: patatin-like phospholipase family protein [Candidatus Margulisiibacteriota bacterium]